MYFYVLDENSVIINSIVIDSATDPSIFGAVADERAMDIGDVWTPPVPAPKERYTADDMLSALLGGTLAHESGGGVISS